MAERVIRIFCLKKNRKRKRKRQILQKRFAILFSCKDRQCLLQLCVRRSRGIEDMKKMVLASGWAEGIFLPAYEKKKLLGYADSFCDLAKSFTEKEGKPVIGQADRQECMLKRRLAENREILADHLTEIAGIMRELAQESYKLQPLKEKEMKKIIRACRENGILIRGIFKAEDEVRGMRLIVELCAMEKHVLTAEDAADYLSVLFDRRLVPEKDSLFFLTGEYETIVFEEEAPYSVLTGAAKATREEEVVSGDSYSFLEHGNGSMTLALSDGMGSGEKAMTDSEAVIDLLEKFMEAGFSKETAVEMINGVLIARSEEGNMSTLDICDVNLYTGECEILKIGASYTYIKRGREVERIESGNLPLGIFHKIDLEKQSVCLKDGDYVIVVSDGVVDGIGDEELLREMLEQMSIQNPQEIANYILQFVLHKTFGRIQDDMTVLCMGIWENAAVDFPE